MSTQPKKKTTGRKQAHQNKEKFFHNPNSVLTKKIYSIEHSCLCDRCNAQIEWRKDYRKYKPLKEMRRCNQCLNKCVNRAYHTICEPCARAGGVCAKCNQPCEASTKPKPIGDEEVLNTIENSCAKERYKRTIMRQWERGVLNNANAIMLIISAEDGKELDWQQYAEDEGSEGEPDLSDDDARDMGVKPKKKAVAKPAAAAAAPAEAEEEKARVIRAGDVNDLGTVHVREMLEQFKI